MPLPSHNRFPYVPITGRQPIEWPGETTVALYVAVCVEHFPYGEGGLGLSYSPGLPHPNTYNWAWREYGNRVGGFRLLELLQDYGIPPTILLNAACYEHCPELLEAYRAANAEFVGHGWTNGQHPNDLDLEAEREMIRKVTELMSLEEGRPPGGWMSPGANPSVSTEDLLAQLGYRYTLDWPHDEQPNWMTTASGPLLSVPYPHEVNDVPMIAFHHGSAAEFADMVIDTVDELVGSDDESPQANVCGIVVHSFILGQPHRLRQFRRALKRIQELASSIWLTTPGAIADHYAELVPPEPKDSTE